MKEDIDENLINEMMKTFDKEMQRAQNRALIKIIGSITIVCIFMLAIGFAIGRLTA